MNRITAAASRELRSLAGVREIGAHIGCAVTSNKSVEVNSGELWVSLDPEANYGRTTNALQDVMAGYPGLRSEVLTYPDQRVRAIGSWRLPALFLLTMLVPMAGALAVAAMAGRSRRWSRSAASSWRWGSPCARALKTRLIPDDAPPPGRARTLSAHVAA